MHFGPRSAVGGAAALAVVLSGVVVAPPAGAAASPTAKVVINEVYGGGGNSGAPLNRDFIELYNPGSAPVSLAGWSVQYASAAGSSWTNLTPLSGSIAAGGSVLVGGASGATGATFAVDVDGAINLSATAGKVALIDSTSPLICSLDCATEASVVDFVGFGTTASSWAGEGRAPAPSNSTSVSRDAAHTNTADNAADFATGAPTPLGGGLVTTPEEPGDPEVVTIAEIQGTGAASPKAGTTVTTEGVVTARYPDGGFNGYVIQTPGTGGALAADRTASDAIFVFSSSTVGSVALGDHVRVTGAVSEFNGLTELTVSSAAGLTKLAEPATVTPLSGTWPATPAAREAIESMLLLPSGDFTISNTYSTNQYGEVGLAAGDKPLVQWTDAARPGTPEAAAVQADNAARGVVLDDGRSTDFLSAANSGLTPPYISTTKPVRVGAKATFEQPVIVDYRNNAWKFNPTQPVVAPDTNSPATFQDDRTAAPANVGGDLKVASFNVLNYFTTLGAGTAGCTSFKDRTGDPVTVNSGCDPRGAWDPDDLTRQQTKIVKAINALDADVVGLLEIENSLVVDGPGNADEALGTLVAALNADAGSTKWAFVPSSSELPAASEMDVITNAIIFQPAAVQRQGASRALGTLSSGNGAFSNAREPIAQAFAPVGGGEPFLFVVNHFKSKGSAGPLPGDADAGDGQGASNASRVAQATALRDWVHTIQGDVESVALVGDFNSYTQEDPLEVLYDAGYADAAAELAPGQYSYSFSGLSGSLDHVLLNGPALARATGADIWEINAEESIALEYSRYNYHGTLFYAPDPYRSSDHDPVIVGLVARADDAPVDLTFLDINDFHGRIDANTVKFAGTVEQQRAAAAGPVAFLSAGDNIGASLFASSLADDQPTIDVLNALGLQASAVGNHEFDKGFADLRDRVIGSDDDRTAGWDYLGANVYAKGTTNPVLKEFSILDMGGVRVGVIGAITQETPSLVTPAGISTLDFGDPVEAVNRVAAQLTDGDEANGEADVLVASYHEGAGAGTPDGATLEQEVAAGGAFAEIVTQTSAKVSAIFTGHTHKQYAWSAPVPGVAGKTRPVVQTGNYGEFLGKVVLTFDPVSSEVTAHSETNIARTTVADDALVTAFENVRTVKTIVDAALAHAAEIGDEPVGSITADITTAFVGANRDDRASESTLGNLVANSLRDILNPAERGGAEIGVVNPGGLRADLLYAKSGAEAKDGIVTFAEANAVLPFVNNLWTTTLTGAQFKTLLEQQWQTNPDGSIPSRPYLQLGLSDNVTYTYDDARPAGSRITSITVAGAAIDPAASYRIGTFSFLATGGDNFRVFTQGANTRDSGLIDRDGWMEYLSGHPDLSPSFARHAVAVTGAPTTIEAGSALDFDVAKLDLTSLGSPANTTLAIALDGASLGSAIVINGAADVVALVPGTTSAGAHTLTLVASPSGTTVTLPLQVTAPVGPEVDLTFLDINDFHGRIDANTVKFAGTVEQQRAAAAGPVAFLSAGDNIGASLFASSLADDQPTIDVLNALGLQASAVGNHEFDKGFADLRDRVIGSDDDRTAGWDYLGANVYAKGTTNPVLKEFSILDMGGVRVGVIGAITQETPSLVTPAGISTLDFGDPVEAVNRVAAQLTDGDEANGEADVLVASYHEGAGAGTPDGATLEQEVAAGGAFAEIVTQTSAKVSAIFTGHTHKQYAWSAPVPGVAGKTRPVVQTGNYGEFLGKVVLTFDPVSSEVTAHSETNIARTTVADDALVTAFENVRTVKTIVDAALAHAAEIGDEPVGSITADITTAFVGANRDDRASESTLGNLVANSLRDILNPAERGGAEIGVVNPGGLRADLLYAKSGAEAKDGIVTFAEANAVLPFVNNLWTTTLTGAQFKTLLEQQWQTNPDGSIPSRPYLQLGLSDNVTYTYDDARPAGSRITSITVAGAAIDPAASYRIGTFSFLATGGDNFRVFTQGANTRDSGLIDRDGWMEYLSTHPALSPDFARHAVAVTGQPTSAFAGDAVVFEVSGLDLTSLGSPANTVLDIRLGAAGAAARAATPGQSIGTATVDQGKATVAVVVPADTAAGAHTLTLVAAPSGTTVSIPLTVAKPAATSVALAVTGSLVVGSQQTITATVSPAIAGSVTFVDGALFVANVPVRLGKASATVSLGVGAHTLRAIFTPAAGEYASSSTTKAVTIAKSASTTKLALSKAAAPYGSPVKAVVTVTGASAAPAGKVELRDGSKIIAVGTLAVTGKKGQLTIAVPNGLAVGAHNLTARYLGGALTNASASPAVRLTMVKAKPAIAMSASSWTVRSGARLKVTVVVSGPKGVAAPTGVVKVKYGSRTLSAPVRNGKAVVILPRATATRAVTATYQGDARYLPVAVSKTLKVRR